MGDQSNELSDERVVEIMNNSFAKKSNPSVDTLSGGTGGKIVSFDRDAGTLTMIFRGTDAMCNGKPGPKSKAQVQGGFACAMLDAVTAQMVVVYSKLQKTVASLEQKTVFISPVPPNKDLYGTAKIMKFGRSIGFLEAELREGSIDGKLLCTSSTTVSLVTLPSKTEKAAMKTKAKL